MYINIVLTMLSQLCDNVVTTLLQPDNIASGDVTEYNIKEMGYLFQVQAHYSTSYMYTHTTLCKKYFYYN